MPSPSPSFRGGERSEFSEASASPDLRPSAYSWVRSVDRMFGKFGCSGQTGTASPFLTISMTFGCGFAFPSYLVFMPARQALTSFIKINFHLPNRSFVFASIFFDPLTPFILFRYSSSFSFLTFFASSGRISSRNG